jgi:antitoxin component YwqK of YwqJK toxin-antitoxin module
MRHLFLLLALFLLHSVSAQDLLGQEHWPDGTLKATRYKVGERVHFITYHESGRVKEMGCFLNGKRDGVWRQYDATGVLLTQASFSLGQRQGVWLFRNTADQVTGRLVYSDGLLARGEQFDDQGALLAQRDY